MSIRSRLIFLVLAVLAPTVVFAAVATYWIYQSQWTRVYESMQETTRAVALAVDRDLARYDAIVTTLTFSRSLAAGDLERFHQRAGAAIRPLGIRVMVFDPDGIPLLDSRRPFGAPLPMSPSLPRLGEGPGMDISRLFFDEDERQYAFAVHRPVLRDGQLAYYVAMEFPAARIGETLVEQGLPARWLGVVLDEHHTIVARTRNAERLVGQSADADFSARIRAQAKDDGSIESITRDGEPVLTFFSRARASGWTVLIALPRDELLASALTSIATVAGWVFLVLLLALLLAFVVGRTITRPLTVLDELAGALGRGEALEAPHTGIDETDRTARALVEASRQIRQSNAVLAEQVADAVARAERSHQALLQGQKLEALGRLTGGIAHDFNNLLQSMTVGLQLADMLSTEPRAKRALEACQRSVARGTQLTRQLMTFSRHRSDEARQVDLRMLVLGMSDLLGGALPSRVTLELDLPEGRWPVQVDPLQCELAILNMALNARDAMPDGGHLTISLAAVQLEVGGHRELPGGPYVELKVADSGQGMSEEVQAKAFEPFFTTKAVGEGTGLGLAQVYGFARQSQGSVSIDSCPGQGTRISLLLPRSVGVVEPAAAALADPAAASGNARVLLVDDDAEVREVVAAILEELGYAVEPVADADAALARLQATDRPAIDLLLSDIVMPGSLDGVGLAQTVRERFPGLPILLATGYTDRAPAERGFRVLTKPFDIATLGNALREALRGNNEKATPGS
ncbi:hybrid sensor histidine kinase/response regulator [Stutzerimonas azotifigens]|uniref:hybrid sensor histidine kinase/response regulator n=1 Tax=Stutzerimonas azotifigens TaxID=291995 RepID=UPI00040174F8|nr:ATP-binding protein [Stutzerimonas azotifigens]